MSEVIAVFHSDPAHSRSILARCLNSPPPPAWQFSVRTPTANNEQRQVEAWRRRSPPEKLQIVSDTTRALVNLSLAGIRRRHPEASEREYFLRLAAILIGVDAVLQICA
jgi:hypothetical protein